MFTLQESLDYLRQKGFALSWNYQDVWREQHVHAFTVAKLLVMDVLVELHQHLDEAIVQGLPFTEFKQRTLHALQAGTATSLATAKPLLTSARLKMIYTTNLRVAHTVGQWQRIERTKDTLPFLIYELGPSREHRDDHIAWNHIIRRVDDVFWQTHMPPNGWGCKCRVRQLSQIEVEQRGGVTPLPAQQTVAWKNKQTGKIESVPKGIDPGWDYNPGQHYLAHMQSVVQEKKQGYLKVKNRVLSKALVQQALVLSSMLKNTQEDSRSKQSFN